MSVGIGYDSHRFCGGPPTDPGRGSRFAHERGLAGHSDADVLTHAVIDALLGAAGGGDIGAPLPRRGGALGANADSVDMLSTVVGTIGGRIVNNRRDAWSARRPRASPPNRAEMERHARGRHLGSGQPSRRRTNEGMGPGVGRARRESACIAVASVESRLRFAAFDGQARID